MIGQSAHRRDRAGRIPTGLLLLAAAGAAVLAAILLGEVQEELRARRTPTPRTAPADVPPQPPKGAPPRPAREDVPPADTPPELATEPVPHTPEPPAPETPKPKRPPRPAPPARTKPAPRPPARFAAAPLPEVLHVLGAAMKRSIVLDPQALGDPVPTVSLVVEGVPPEKLLAQVCEQLGLVSVERDGALLITTPARREALAAEGEALRPLQQTPTKALAERMATPVSVDFAQTPLPDVASFFATLLDLSVVLDPGALQGEVPRVTLQVEGMRAERALQWACRLAGLVPVWRDGALLLTTPERARDAVRQDRRWLPRQKPPTEELARQLARDVSFQFVATPLRDALAYLGSLTEVPLVLEPQTVAGRAPTVTLAVHAMPLGQALRWVCRVAGLTYRWEDGRILITTPAGARDALRQEQ